MVAAVAKVKDEADFIERSVGHMLTQVDHVLVADNNSTDGTVELLEGLPVELIHISDRAHYQARHMTELVAKVAREGADYVVPFDADEIWYSPFGRIADVLEEHEGAIYPAWIYEHVATQQGMDWRYREHGLHKVACRTALPASLAEGSHQVAYPEQTVVWDQVIVRHFPYRHASQFVTKVRNGYDGRRRTDLPVTSSVHLREWGALLEAEGEEALHKIFYERFFVEEPERDPTLILDPAPVACPSPA